VHATEAIEHAGIGQCISALGVSGL
jgi:hypothetical protein